MALYVMYTYVLIIFVICVHHICIYQLYSGRLVICYYNWKSIIFACMIMASKVWDDLSMWNTDFAQVSSVYDLQRGKYLLHFNGYALDLLLLYNTLPLMYVYNFLLV